MLYKSHPRGCHCGRFLVTCCEVFPPGTPDYEAMASLGRMVAQCGPGIEDVVRQRKTQDPSLWYDKGFSLQKHKSIKNSDNVSILIYKKRIIRLLISHRD